MHIGAKVFSSMMCKILFKRIKLHRCPTKFRYSPGVGCQYGHFSSKRHSKLVINTTCQYIFEFVGLVKSFDTVSHSMILKVIERYGAPPKLRSTIERMYADLNIVLKTRKAKSEMGQKVGLRQGDCMAPVFYLFMIMAFAETLDISWKQLVHKIIAFNMRKNSPRQRGSLIGHAPQNFYEGTILELFNVLYVNDGDFPFEDRDQLAKGVQLIYDHFKRFGLEMHIGKGVKPSKTECVFFFPLPGLFKRKQTLPAMDNSANKAMAEKKRSVQESHEGKCQRQEIQYFPLPKTRLVVVSEVLSTSVSISSILGHGSHFPYATTMMWEGEFERLMHRWVHCINYGDITTSICTPIT